MLVTSLGLAVEYSLTTVVGLQMKTVLLVLLLLGDTLAVPTMEDNKIPTDQEILGQPEEVASLGLPSDEESFNRLSVFFNPGKPTGPIGSGTYHFVSSTFPGTSIVC